MAPVAPSSETDFGAVPIQEIIFSCSICQATPSEVYATPESNHGFHSGLGDDAGIVTKMWIASCSHISCSKHFQDGAVPFHPADQPPQAACPTCIKDHEDDSPKGLYGLRGVDEGQYDAIIPTEWFQCPPMKLDTSVPGMGAVRFQYVALSHYAREAKCHWKKAENKLRTAEKACTQERKARRQIQADAVQLRDRIQVLEKSDVRLKRWEARKPMIEHYLAQMDPIAKELRMLRETLRGLGYEVSNHNYGFDAQPSDDGMRQLKPGSNHRELRENLQAASHNRRPAMQQNIEIESSSSARKRKRDHLGEAHAYDEQTKGHEPQHRGSSRDLMPPPLPRPNIMRQPPLASPAGYQEPPGSRLSTFGRDRDARLVDGPSAYVSVKHSLQNEGNNVTQLHQSLALPVRSNERPESQTSRHRPQDLNAFRNFNGNKTAAQHALHDTQPFERLSINSPEQQRHRYSRPGGVQALPVAHRSLERDHRGGQSHHYGPEYGISAPRNVYHVPHDRSLTAISEAVRATPSPQKRIVAPQANSVISPFFKRGSAAVQPQHLQHPPTRESFVRCAHPPLHNAAAGYQLAPTSRNVHDPRHQHETQQISRSPFIDRLRRSNDPPDVEPAQGYSRAALSRDTQVAPNGQPSEGYQRFIRRPDVPPSRIAHPSTASQPYRGHQRISLPSLGGRPVQSAAGQDYALSQIQGVRGISSQRGVLNNHGPPLGSNRNLFSAAGSRRSVRR